jgi:catechol 2,3-dioxygenase-like lactoylglutathione lyase family enzyme
VRWAGRALDADGEAIRAEATAGPRPRLRRAVPALPVADVRRALAWWGEVLGLHVQHEESGFGIVRDGDVEVHVWLADGSAPGAEAALAGSASCRIEVRHVAVLAAHAVRLGVVHARGALRTTGWGTREVDLLDPDGNLVTLFEPLAG